MTKAIQRMRGLFYLQVEMDPFYYDREVMEAGTEGWLVQLSQ